MVAVYPSEHGIEFTSSIQEDGGESSAQAELSLGPRSEKPLGNSRR